MRKRLAAIALSGGLAVSAVSAASAAPSVNGPVGGLVNAIVQVEDSLNNNTVEVLPIDISNSLNNLLQNAFQNADIDVLTNSLNNLLQNADIDVIVTDITVVGDSIVVSVLGGDQIVLS